MKCILYDLTDSDELLYILQNHLAAFQNRNLELPPIWGIRQLGFGFHIYFLHFSLFSSDTKIFLRPELLNYTSDNFDQINIKNYLVYIFSAR